MSDKNKKKHSALDKVIMGAIIGTAIGSAIGAAAAPKKGEETREILKEKATVMGQEAQEVGKLAKETGNGLWKLIRLLFSKGKKKVLPPETGMKKIPHEMDIISEERVD